MGPPRGRRSGSCRGDEGAGAGVAAIRGDAAAHAAAGEETMEVLGLLGLNGVWRVMGWAGWGWLESASPAERDLEGGLARAFHHQARDLARLHRHLDAELHGGSLRSDGVD